MGNRGRAIPYDFSVWEQFSGHMVEYRLSRGFPVATSDQIKTIKLVIVKLVQDQIAKNGAKGVKRKRALKRFRELIEQQGSPMIQIVTEATRLGVPYEDMSAIVTLFK